ncbi:MAG: aminodeoxychorismate synthase component I [Gammaproteobacteria bacterium]|nr:aminodeoxychorismate synthase component I [Gammaproteobacteria bacterium]
MNYPLITEIDYVSPLQLFAVFKEDDGALFLDSAAQREFCGRYSFIAIDPFATLISKNGHVRLNQAAYHGDPFAILERELSMFSLGIAKDLPPFQGGVAGFFSYDLYQHLEDLPKAHTDDMQFPDMALGFYDLVIGFDEALQKAWIFSSGYPLQEKVAREERAKNRTTFLLEIIKKARHLKCESLSVSDPDVIFSNFSRKAYQSAVDAVREYIFSGDIFEANISQRFNTPLPEKLTPFELYQRLRAINPAPFSAYLQFEGTVLASASPERFLKLSQGQVEARPIKGTSPRGATPYADAILAEALVRSEKDRAENVMIVDLLRNDLSRVSCDHSVKVPILCGLESYATVHHLVSVVTSQLKETYHAVDLLRATFPGGSITGAPKLRAMEIIAEIEPTARGPYCGSIGYIGFNGDMDCSITIRTFAIKNDIVTFQAGGAVVSDSDPIAEYEETLTKVRPLKTALTTVPNIT